LVAVAGVAVYAGSVLATPQTGLTAVQVAKGTFGDLDIRSKVKTDTGDKHKVKIETQGDSDVYVVQNTFDPGGQSGWHTHPGPSLIIVTSGSITAYDGDDPTCSPMVYTAGQGFVDPGDGHVHLLRNESGAPAQTVAIQFLPKDAVRKIDAPAPGNCPF
jgi:quercetin dioxygenase-like cupin family protein